MLALKFKSAAGNYLFPIDPFFFTFYISAFFHDALLLGKLSKFGWKNQRTVLPSGIALQQHVVEDGDWEPIGALNYF
jgi:hypothetical protein